MLFGRLLVCALVVAACARREAPSTAAPDAATAPALSAVLLSSDAAWQLTIDLDPERPKGRLIRAGKPYDLHSVALAVESAGGSPPVIRVRYRLSFAIDACLHEEVPPPGAWPGLCGGGPDQPKRVRLEEHALLIDRQTVSPNPQTAIDTLEAACVPSSGSGPSCQLHGTVAVLSDGTRTVNGR